jgi:ABC-type polysaccharide/polyol phosphate transport system ATPase subunit
VPPAIELDHVSKHFRLYQEKYQTLKERILHAGKVPFEDFIAVNGVTADIPEAQTVGILGRNGSGKSTLLKCIAGILQPTSGRIVLRGQLAAMVELGAGMQPELSGRDNIFLSGSLLGLSRREITRRFDEIVAFAELENFIDNQVKYYSSGMAIRLGFAVAVNVDPDILLVDEVLAVGDERFQQKCLDRIGIFQREGRTIVFVAHAPDLMRQLCQRVLVLERGTLIADGEPGESIRTFRKALKATDDALLGLEDEDEDEDAADGEDDGEQGRDARAHSTGDRSSTGAGRRPAPRRGVRAKILAVTGAHAAEAQRPYLLPGESLELVVSYEIFVPLTSVVFAIQIRARGGENLLYAADSGALGGPIDLGVGAGRMTFVFDSVPFLDGTFDVQIALQRSGGGLLYDRMDPAFSFEVMNPGHAGGILTMPMRVEHDHSVAS